MSWFGNLPQAAWGVYGTPPFMAPREDIDPPAQSPFTWGAGGAMVRPEELARQREISDAQMRSDYSPVGSVWQGLGRVADNVIGALRARKLDKAEETNAAASKAILDGLINPGGGVSEGGAAPGAQAGAAPDRQQQLLQAMSSPYADDNTRSIAKMLLEREFPKAANNDTVADYNFIVQQLGEEAGRSYLRSKANPIQWIQADNGDGTRLLIPMGPGGPMNQAPSTSSSPPATLPPDFDFGAPTTENTPAPAVGGNGFPAMLTLPQYQAVVGKMGKEATDAWMARNGIGLGN